GKPGGGDQPRDTAGIGQRKRQVEHLTLSRKIPAERFREHSPDWRTLARRDDAHDSPAASTHNAAEFAQTTSGIWKEHEAKLTDHGVEDAIGEWKGLAIGHHRSEPWIISESRRRGLEDTQRDIRADHEAG